MTSPYDVINFKIVANVSDQTFWVNISDMTCIICLAVINWIQYSNDKICVAELLPFSYISIFLACIVWIYESHWLVYQWKLAKAWAPLSMFSFCGVYFSSITNWLIPMLGRAAMLTYIQLFWSWGYPYLLFLPIEPRL